jgi:chromosome segregation ATPase
MVANRDGDPIVVIEGLENIIERDLLREKSRLGQAQRDLKAFQDGVSHHVQKKRYYKTLIGGEKFNDESLKQSIADINTNIRHMSDKKQLALEKIEWHKKIIKKLESDLAEQRDLLATLKKYREGMQEKLDKGEVVQAPPSTLKRGGNGNTS